MSKLTATEVKNAKPRDKDYKLFDGGGLFLLVKRNGSKYWRLKYRVDGKKERALAFGVYPAVSLAQAREKRAEAKAQLAQGIDPSDAKKAEKLTRQLEGQNTFEAMALRWFAHEHGGTKPEDHGNKTHPHKQWRLLEKHLFPVLAGRPITDITPREIMGQLNIPLQAGNIETAHRVKGVAGKVFSYAIVNDLADRNPAQELTGALPPKPPANNRAAIIKPTPFSDMLVKLDEADIVLDVKIALQLVALLFPRSGELVSMRWDQIDWESGRWDYTVKKDGNKRTAPRPHVVPLSRQALEHLSLMQQINGNQEYVFYSRLAKDKHLTTAALSNNLRDKVVKTQKHTVHGFRASARTMLTEVLKCDWLHVELQLAHVKKDPNGTAYDRATFLSERTTMMQLWADYLDNLKAQAKAGNVVTGDFRQLAE